MRGTDLIDHDWLTMTEISHDTPSYYPFLIPLRQTVPEMCFWWSSKYQKGLPHHCCPGTSKLIPVFFKCCKVMLLKLFVREMFVWKMTAHYLSCRGLELEVGIAFWALRRITPPDLPCLINVDCLKPVQENGSPQANRCEYVQGRNNILFCRILTITWLSIRFLYVLCS